MSSSPAIEGGELAPGAVIAGRFVVESRLGAGGMGDVYRVAEQRTGRRVALKRLRFDPTDPEKQEKLAALFEHEYHSLVQLTHPRIVQVHDYGLDGAAPFYTMELLDGDDLQRCGQQAWPQACRWLLDVASSLAMLHSRRLLHRDLSPRNVRITADGRAKLIDFGALTPMGAVKTVAGTPISVAPEVLARELLDARVDLYSLGVLAYWMLTGRFPYSVKTFAELPSAWLSMPLTPRELVPELPLELDALVMGLLHHDRMARPASAAEVMERLSSIAGLSLTEHSAVTNAYLVTPPLIGRGELLAAVRARLARPLHAQAGTIVIEGHAGSGRSRALDACVLEARLLGLTVLRGDAADGASGDYGLARALCAQLFELVPEATTLAAAQAPAQRASLAYVCPQLAARRDATPARAEGAQLQAAILELWLAVARDNPLVIAVDDGEEIDEPSAALLAAIADRTSDCNITLLLARCSREPALGAVAFVREAAALHTLAAFDAEQTEALMRGVFGDVQYVGPVAARVHELCNGNPLGAMTLAEQLVAQGLAQYEAGGWKLPAAFAPGDLPESLSAQWRARIDALCPDARELAEVLAVVEPGSLTIADYPLLTSHRETGRCYRALDTLVAQGFLVWAGQQHRLAQRELVTTLASGVSAERAPALHTRIALAQQRRGYSLLAAGHLFRAGRIAQAVALLLALNQDSKRELSLRAIALLEQAIAAMRVLDSTPYQRYALSCWLTSAASVLGRRDVMVRYGLPLLEQLERDSGLQDYLALSALPDDRRLVAALEQVAARYAATPEAARGPAPVEALTQLAKLCSGIANLALLAQDIELLDRLPSLNALASLSPAFEVVDLLTLSARDLQAGRLRNAIDACAQALARVEQPDRAGLEPVLHQGTRCGLLYMQGVLAAAYGLPNAGDFVAELEHEPGHRAGAFRVRMSCELMRGDVDAAQACQRRAELLELEDNASLRYRGATARVELLAHYLAADLIGIKRAMERIEHEHASYPHGWMATLALARGCYLRIKGEPARALDAVRSVLPWTLAGRHLDWALLAGLEASILSDLERHDEALDRAVSAWALHEHEHLSGTTGYLLQIVAAVLHAAGRHQAAVDWADRSIASYEDEGRAGLCLGSCYETRARIAAALGDRVGFMHNALRCSEEYRRGQSPAVTAKHERLMHYGQQHGVHESSRPPAADQAADTHGSASDARTATVTSVASERRDSKLPRAPKQRANTRRVHAQSYVGIVKRNAELEDEPLRGSHGGRS